MKSIKFKSHKKVAIGLSGGVDSAVSAYLLKKQGYEVSAVYLMCWKEPGCRAEDDRKDAMKTALELNIPFQVLDFRKEYKEKVLNYFFEEYKNGRTPNPDVLCNSEIKFGLFYDWALHNTVQGKLPRFDYIATGHYVKIIKTDPTLSDFSHKIRCAQDDKLCLKSLQSLSNKDCKYSLVVARDLKKDQSYFLYRLKKEQLKHILFPVGNFLKMEVREIAKKARLSVANKKDSMGICFVGDINVNKFLKEKFGVRKGKVKLSDGTVVGEHDGYFLFNVGKTGSWKLETGNKKLKDVLDMANLPKLYVTKINKEKNEIVVGEREECERNEFGISQIHFLNPKFEIRNSKQKEYYVKIRNTGDFLKAKLGKTGKDEIRAKLFQKEFGVSSGQSCVFYRKLNYESGIINNDKTQNSKLKTQNYNLNLKNDNKEGVYELVGGGIII